MCHNNHSFEFDFKFSQCSLFDDTTTKFLDISPVHRVINKKKDTLMDEKIEEKPVVQSIDIFDKELNDMKLYESKLSAFCGLWEDYPCRRYRMEFRIEMGQLVGYSNANGGKASASYDGKLLNMIIVYPNETGRPINHYRGRLGWSQKYITWEKEDFSRENGWRPTRRWIKIE